MTFVRLKGFKFYKDRHGKERCYHRASRQPIDLVKFPRGSLEFMAECNRIMNLGRAKEPKPGTLGLLISAYRKHDDYRSKATRTRRDYDRCLDYLKSIDDTLLSAFDAPLIVGIRDKAGEAMGRKWGNYTKAVLSLLFSWGLERGYVESNPATGIKGIKKAKDAPEANRPWSDSERHAVWDEAEPVFRAPLSFMMFCGLDPGDVCKLPGNAVRDGQIDSKRRKTSQPVWIPLPSPVVEALESAPKHSAITLLAAPNGNPWPYSTLDNHWQKLKRRLLAEGKIEPGLTLKGLRHTVASILAEIGYDGRSIADMLGQKTTAMGDHYSRRADRRKKVGAIVKNFEAEVKRRTKGA